MRGRPLGSKTVWASSQLKDRRSLIVGELAAIESTSGPQAKLDEIQNRLAQIDVNSSDSARLDAYILIMAALVTHAKHGILPIKIAKKLYQDGIDVLKLQRVTTDKPRHARLYADLNIAISQAYRLDGHHWLALWYQQFAESLAERDELRHSLIADQGHAIRLMRIGQVPQAAARLEKILSLMSQDDGMILSAGLALVRCKRLTCDYDEAKALIARLHQNPVIDERSRLELDWESLCLEWLVSRDYTGLMRATQNGQPHYVSAYVAEARLIGFAQNDERAQERMVKLKTLKSNPHLKLYEAGAIYEILNALETAYDAAFGLEHRHGLLAEALEEIGNLISVDQELLALASIARWLKRHSMPLLCDAIVRRHQFLSLQASNMKSVNCWNVIDDLV